MTAALANPAQKAPAMCFPIVGTRGMRITAVDGCGRPDLGRLEGMAVSTGVVSIELEPETEDGDDYSQKNAAGQECFPAFTGPSFIKWWNVTIEFCNFDPELFALICPNWPGVDNYTRTRKVGWRMGSKLQPDDGSGFALETWPKSAGTGVAQACYETGQQQGEDTAPGGYFLLPWVVPDAPDSFTLENEPSTFTIKGKTKPGSLWLKGPYNVVANEPDTPGGPPKAGPLIDPIDPGFKLKPEDDKEQKSGTDSTHFHGELTTIAPPDFKKLGCGTHPLWDETKPQAQLDTSASSGMTGSVAVTNFDAIGGHGTINWGDAVENADYPSSPQTHQYAAEQSGVEQTITFYPANKAKPTTVKVTPKSAARDESDPHTIALTLDDPPAGLVSVDWGDGATEQVTGSGPHAHTYTTDGSYTVVTTSEAGSELTRDVFTAPKPGSKKRNRS